MSKKRILITGMAGFIGFSLTEKLAKAGAYDITGLDNINDYYSPQLKYARLAQLGFEADGAKSGTLIKSNRYDNLQFIRLDLQNLDAMQALFASERFDIVVHLAAQAGVRYSMENPHAYIASNVSGFVNLLECCKVNHVKHLIFASSSSVYGDDASTPYRETQRTDHPVSLYAATKKSNELMAYTYHHLYNLPITGLRFFTVYGPWGRPDMAPMLFASAIQEGRPIKVFNYGKLKRDFTYVDDIVDGIERVMQVLPGEYKIYNIGNSKPVDLMEFIELMEKGLGKEAKKELLPMQPGDVHETYADTTLLSADTGYKPNTPLEKGIEKFLAWYLEYYKLSTPVNAK